MRGLFSCATFLSMVGVVSFTAHSAAAQYVVTQLPDPAGYSADGSAINNRGDVAGTAFSTAAPGSTFRAFLYTAEGGYQFLPGVSGFANTATGGGSLNDAGDVVGTATSDVPNTPGSRGFLYHAGTVTNLAPPGMTLGSHFAWGISNNGYVVGWESTPAGTHAYRRLGDTVVDLGQFNGGLADARVVNEAGHVAGMGPSGAFLYRDGTMVDLGTLGGTQMYVRGINNSDQVVGNASTASGQARAFLYSDGQMTDFLGLNVQSQANGINEAGQVVGMVETLPTHEWHGFVYQDGTVRDLNSLVTLAPGWTITGGWDVNDRGQILASATDAAGAVHNLILTPVPEPASAALLAAPAALCLLRRRK
jgi:probable HAF family extracellular repeat protein